MGGVTYVRRDPPSGHIVHFGKYLPVFLCTGPQTDDRGSKCDDCRLRTSILTLHQGQFSHDYGRFPNDCWSINIVGKMDEDEGCHYILSCQDMFWIIRVVRLPQWIRTDMGLEFNNALLHCIQKRWTIQITNSVLFFHQSNMVERCHRELNRGMKLLLPDPPHGWVQAVTLLALATTVNQTE